MTREEGSGGVMESRGERDRSLDRGCCAAGSVEPKTRSDAGLLPVVERFVSVNGEGPWAGCPAAFVRFRGCNLACSYCDTAWANDPECPAELLSVEEVAAWVRAAGPAHVTLTGGEPALQPDLPALLKVLLGEEAASTAASVSASKPSCGNGEGAETASSFVEAAIREGMTPALAVEIETNGAVDLAPLARVRSALETRGMCGSLAFTMDWKLPSSGMEARMMESNLALLGARDALKFVAASREDLQEMTRVLQRTGVADQCTVLVSPVFGALEPTEIADFLKENRLWNVRLQVQLHKIIWPDVDRGV